MIQKDLPNSFKVSVKIAPAKENTVRTRHRIGGNPVTTLRRENKYCFLMRKNVVYSGSRDSNDVPLPFILLL